MRSPKEIAFDKILDQLIKDKIRYENMEGDIARCIVKYIDCYIDYMYEILYM